MKLYYAYNEDGQVTSSVQEDYLKIEDWKIIHPDYILQDEEGIGRNNDILKVVDGVVVLDTEKIAQNARNAQLQELKEIRDNDLQSNTVEHNGAIFNTRPSDLSNFQLGIDKNDSLWPDINDYMIDVSGLAQRLDDPGQGLALQLRI